jgi:hypothetical protein
LLGRCSFARFLLVLAITAWAPAIAVAHPLGFSTAELRFIDGAFEIEWVLDAPGEEPRPTATLRRQLLLQAVSNALTLSFEPDSAVATQEAKILALGEGASAVDVVSLRGTVPEGAERVRVGVAATAGDVALEIRTFAGKSGFAELVVAGQQSPWVDLSGDPALINSPASTGSGREVRARGTAGSEANRSNAEPTRVLEHSVQAALALAGSSIGAMPPGPEPGPPRPGPPGPGPSSPGGGGGWSGPSGGCWAMDGSVASRKAIDGMITRVMRIRNSLKVVKSMCGDCRRLYGSCLRGIPGESLAPSSGASARSLRSTPPCQNPRQPRLES